MSPAGHARRVHRPPPAQAGSRQTGSGCAAHAARHRSPHHASFRSHHPRPQTNNGERALPPYVPRRGLRDQLDELRNEAAVHQGKDLGRSRSVAAVRQVRGPKPGMSGWQLLGLYR